MLPKIKEAIVVEGKYDKIKLASLVDAVILETEGFHIFKDGEKLKLIRKMAETTGVILLLDSDGAGFVIRNYLTGALPSGCIKQAYIPDVYGKEKRKLVGSKEGKLGVEGVPKDMLLEALKRSGATFVTEAECAKLDSTITKQDLFDLGLSGGDDSKAMRQWLLKQLQLPERMATNGMLRVLQQTMTRQELLALVQTYPGL